MEKIFNREQYIQFVNDHRPEPHRSRWTNEEDNIILVCIENDFTLLDIAKIISLRTSAAICTRANHLGYGFCTNKDDGLTYFHTGINHKNRRSNDEISEGREKIPIKSRDFTGTNIEVNTDIIPKVEISVADIDKIIKILTTAKALLCSTK